MGKSNENDPYRSPKFTNGEDKTEYVKLVGITLKKSSYISLQVILMLLFLILGFVFNFVLSGQFFGYKANSIGWAFWGIFVLEICETAYALSSKTFTK